MLSLFCLWWKLVGDFPCPYVNSWALLILFSPPFPSRRGSEIVVVVELSWVKPPHIYRPWLQNFNPVKSLHFHLEWTAFISFLPILYCHLFTYSSHRQTKIVIDTKILYQSRYLLVGRSWHQTKTHYYTLMFLW